MAFAYADLESFIINGVESPYFLNHFKNGAFGLSKLLHGQECLWEEVDGDLMAIAENIAKMFTVPDELKQAHNMCIEIWYNCTNDHIEDMDYKYFSNSIKVEFVYGHPTITF